MSAAADPVGMLPPVSTHLRSVPGPGSTFSFRRRLRTWPAGIKGFSVPLAADLLLKATLAMAGSVLASAQLTRVMDRGVEFLEQRSYR